MVYKKFLNLNKFHCVYLNNINEENDWQHNMWALQLDYNNLGILQGMLENNMIFYHTPMLFWYTIRDYIPVIYERKISNI